MLIILGIDNAKINNGREMGDHFGNLLFLKPLVVLISIISSKSMR